VAQTKQSGHQVLPRADTNGPLICLLQCPAPQVGTLLDEEACDITPRPRRGAVVALAAALPLPGTPGAPPGGGAGLGIPPMGAAGLGAGAAGAGA